MTMVENDSCAKIVEVLNKIDVKRLKRLAKHDGDIKTMLELVEACKCFVRLPKRMANWHSVAKALYEKIKSYDPRHINLVDHRRKDGTWCMWMTWDSITEFGTTSGYSLVASGHCGEDETTCENAAKSFIADFCRVGPICLQIYNDSTISTRQRLANAAIVAVYKELDCPKTVEDVYAKLLLGKSR